LIAPAFGDGTFDFLVTHGVQNKTGMILGVANKRSIAWER
jgi:hypothetical protein